MRFSDRLSVVLAREGTTYREPEVELRLDGRPTGRRLPGRVLEAALEAVPGADWGWLLFVTHDITFEEQLDIVLLSASLATLDRMIFGGLYTTGTFRDLCVLSGHAASFAFFADERWTSTVLDRPHWRLPIVTAGWSGVRGRLRLARATA